MSEILSPSGPADAGTPSRARVWLQRAGPIVLALFFVALTIWTWRRWGSPRIDHGQQLYLAWQLSEGRDLYRDIAWVYGPLSQYLNALFFRLFGVSYTTLIVCNLAILAGLSALLHELIARLADRLTAFLAVAAFFCLFAFAHLVNLGNYNFVTPYTHEATHGTVLCFVLLACVIRANARTSRGACVTIGACIAGGLLTKPEILLATAGTAAWGLGFGAWVGGRSARELRREAAGVAIGFAGAMLLALLFLTLRTSAGDAFFAVVAAYAPLWSSDIGANFYFQEGLGLTRPWTNLGRTLGSAAVAALGVAIFGAVDARARRLPRWSVAVCGGAVFLVLSLAFPPGPWTFLGASLPAATLVVFGLFAWEAVRARRAGDAALARRFVALSAWCVLALGLLAKMPLGSRLHHYGFFLAMPGTLVLIVAVAWWLPLRLRERSGRGQLVRAVAAAVVLAACLAHLEKSWLFYRTRVSPFGRGGDLMLTQGRADRVNVMQQTLRRIEAVIPPGDTFVALPYGIMLNYQTRRRNPAPYMRWTGLELIIWGEEHMRAELEASDPDWVVLISSASQEEFGLGPYGRDPRNGKALVEWINGHYETVDRIGAEPFTSHLFGAKIMRRPERQGDGAP